MVRPAADLLGERPVLLPKADSGAMLHPRLQRLDSTVLFVVQSLLDGAIETSSRKIGLKANVDGLRTILVKP
jgi:hypothetical protein